MKKINSYITEKLKLNKNTKESKEEKIQDFIIDFYNKKNLKYGEHYNIEFSYLNNDEKFIYIKFNDKVHKSIVNTGKELCIEMENEIGYDYYWSINGLERPGQLILHNRFI